MTPQNLFLKIKKSWSSKYSIVFVSTFLFGLIAHSYRFFNLLPNYDSLNSLYSPQNTIHLGRCFLILGCGISSFYDLSLIIGLLSLIYISFTTILITELFEIKQTLSIVLTSGLFVTFPVITCTFAFMYTADGYFLAMLLVTIAIFMASKSKKYIVPSAICIAFSLGMYQAYILFGITLTLIFIMKKMTFDQVPFKKLLAPLVQIFFSGTLGAFLYFISYKSLLILEQKSLSGYNGLNTMSLSNLPDFGDSIYNCLKSFVSFFFYSEKGLTPYIVLNIFMWIFMITYFLILLHKRRKSMKIYEKIIFLLCSLCLPFVIFFYLFISSVDYHTLMLQSIALILLFIIFFLENSNLFPKTQILIQWFCTLLAMFMIYNFILISNITYTTMHNSFERSTAVINRMADRIEQLSDLDSAPKLAVIGKLPGSDDTINNFPPDMVGTVPNYIMRIQPNYIDMLKNYNNLYFTDATYPEIDEILKTNDYSTMQVWPRNESIKIINNTVVIKLGEPYYDYSNE